ncbi:MULTISPECIES: hypothetical protein [unclassified Nocardioides]|uniref:hypothetical protein n=1 Tax=unclassified Nocardioides TaxID=2615069 RepID=UPI00360786D5
MIPFDDGELPAADAAEVLPLTGDLVLQAGNNLNGIVSGYADRRGSGHRGDDDRRHRHGRGYGFGSGLIAIQSNTGTLLRIDPRTGETDALELDGEPLVNGDGIELDRHGRLWVLRNSDNLLVEVRLGHRSASVEDANRYEGFDVPSTGTLLRDSFYAVNARFGIQMPETAEFWITRVELD